MKYCYKVEVEVDDEYVESWTQNYMDYHVKLYNGDRERARKMITDYPLEASIASDIESSLVNSSGIKTVKVNIEEDE